MNKKGIEFTESMIQLILDRKIAGYELRAKPRWYEGKICILQVRELSDFQYADDGLVILTDDVMLLTNIHDKDIPYDSFNPGIKVGDENWFTGDLFEIGEHYVGKILCKPCTAVLTITDSHEWIVENIGDDDNFASVDDLMFGDVKWKKIGSIYEK